MGQVNGCPKSAAKSFTHCETWSRTVRGLLVSLFLLPLYGGCNVSKYSDFISKRVEFTNSGNILHRNKIAYLHFADPFPKILAHRGSSYSERYVESLPIVITSDDLEPRNVSDEALLINVFFGSNYFHGGAVDANLVNATYEKSLSKTTIKPAAISANEFEIHDKYCAVKRTEEESVIGRSFVVIDIAADDKLVEHCLYFGIAHAFGIRADISPPDDRLMIERDIDVTVHSAAQRCLDKTGQTEATQCILNFLTDTHMH